MNEKKNTSFGKNETLNKVLIDKAIDDLLVNYHHQRWWLEEQGL